jgi:hypothetical protein
MPVTPWRAWRCPARSARFVRGTARLDQVAFAQPPGEGKNYELGPAIFLTLVLGNGMMAPQRLALPV